MPDLDRETPSPRVTTLRMILRVFAILSLLAGIGLTAWGITRGNHLSAIVGVALVIDAGIVVWVAGRLA